MSRLNKIPSPWRRRQRGLDFLQRLVAAGREASGRHGGRRDLWLPRTLSGHGGCAG